MRKQPRTYSTAQFLSVIVMLVSLLWLTVSLPFVYKAQQQTITWSEQDGQAEDPFSDTTEEKAPSSASASEEYLHHDAGINDWIAKKLRHDHRHAYDVYVAFHGELISPPPDLFLS